MTEAVSGGTAQEADPAASAEVAPAPSEPTPRVLDASAMLAFLLQEPGGDQVAGLLADPAVRCWAHAINLCEVYLTFARRTNRATAQAAVSDLLSAGVLAQPDLDQATWEDAGDLVALARNTSGWTLSLADGVGLALARRLGCEFVTADHREFDPVVARGLGAVRFIR